MKSERRHKLATNELADWVTHFPEYVKKNRGTIIIVAAIVIAFGLYSYYYYYIRGAAAASGKNEKLTSLLEFPRRNKERAAQGYIQGPAVSDEFIMTASQLSTIAAEMEQTSSVFSAIALIKQAETLRAELHYRAEEAPQDITKYQIGQAEEIYRKALDIAGENMTIEVMAKFGIGLCAEELGDFDGALKIYQEIAAEARYESSPYSARAKLRAATMDDCKGEVFFTQHQLAETPDTTESVFSAAPLTEANSVEE